MANNIAAHRIASWAAMLSILVFPDCVARTTSVQTADGIKIEFSYAVRSVDPTSGPRVRTQFVVSDEKSKYLLTGLHPFVWYKPSFGDEKKEPCEPLARQLLKGGTGDNVATVSVHGFELITLNEDDTVAILDPKINLATSNLVSLIQLPGKATAWNIDHVTGTLVVLLADRGTISLIDLGARRLRGEIQVDGRPQTMMVNTTTHQVWVSSGQGVTIIDLGTGRIRRKIPIQSNVIASGQDRNVWVGNQTTGIFTLFDARSYNKLRDVGIGAGKFLVSYSLHSNALYVVNTTRSEMTVLYGADLTTPPLTVPFGDDVTSLATSPDGRFIILMKAGKRAVEILDAANNRLVRELPIGSDSDYLGFTKNFAYVRNRGSNTFTAIHLDEIAQKQYAPLTITVGIGQDKKDAAVGKMSPFASIAGDEQVLMILNPSDKTIYWYMEGMLAPQSSFKTFTAAPRSVLVYDRGLRESNPGTYKATASLSESGRYLVVLGIDSPRVFACFDAFIKGNKPNLIASQRQLQVTGHFDNETIVSAKPVTLRFTLTDAISKKKVYGVTDIQVLAYLEDGRYQIRGSAKSRKAGGYETVLNFPVSGKYRVAIESIRLGLRYSDFTSFHAVVR